MSTIKGVKIKPSPKFMQAILAKHGIKCINNVVDIGNYVTLLTGQPLHMYDASRVKSKKFVVKDNVNCITRALDDKEYEISNGDLVITNNDEVACIAGVIGSASTMILNDTSTIALEVALFDGTTIMNSCKKYGIMTVAATNYSKNAVDKYNAIKASDMACALLVKYADASYVSLPYEYDKRNLKEKVIDIDLSFINTRLGSNYSTLDVENVLRRLDFAYNLSNEHFVINVPSYRNDITIKEDIVEEVVRLIGFDTIPYQMASIETKDIGLDEIHLAKRKINNYLLDLGLHNTLSYTLINKEQANYYGVFDDDSYIVLPHPLTVEKQYLRKNMICSMLQTIAYNQTRGYKDVAIYEISNVYTNENLEGKEKLAIAISNHLNETKWSSNKNVDFYMMKGIVEGLLALFGIDSNRYSFEPISKAYNKQNVFHPGKSALLKVNGANVGIIGMIHPLTLKREGIDETVYCEIDLSQFLKIKTSKAKYNSVSKFPSVSRDIALVVKEDVTISMLCKSMKKAGGPLLNKIEVFDVYQGEHVAKGYKSVAFTLTFVDLNKTLVDATVNELFNKVYASCQHDFDAIIRN
ncbi:MAG: phenylalanine--tRNA ligase subunit beta [Erysipelotrichaceae bacterium]|nr:phenylalanine--tRNA ligase subunit beta [Erysipelotrichaceae bacterium]